MRAEIKQHLQAATAFEAVRTLEASIAGLTPLARR